jgi:hypothetical protein
MNERSDMDRVLRQWFDDGPSTMPDRVVDVVADRITRERQRPARRLHWRPFGMNSTIKIGAAIAAVLVLAIVGWNLLPGRSTGVAGSTPAPSPSPAITPSASPDDDASSAWAGAGVLPAGTHSSLRFVPAVTFTVPEGWTNGVDGEVAGYDLSTGSSGTILIQATDGWADGWGICAAAYAPGAALTAADITAALRASEHLVTTEPVPVTIGGLEGQRLDVHLSSSGSGVCEPASDDPPDLDFSDIRLRLVVLDHPDGSDVVPILLQSGHAAEFDHFVADAMPIVESFEFDLEVAASPSPS